MLIIPIICLAEMNKISDGNSIILQTYYPYKSTWLPTKEQTRKSLNAIYKFLESPVNVSDWQKAEITKIRKNLSAYNVQFVGIEINGKKRIWCNFFRGDNFKNWKKQVVHVLDGGFWFWQIEYVLEKDSCISFRSNGYA